MRPTNFRCRFFLAKINRESTYTNCIQLYVVLAIHAAVSLIDFQQIENNWTHITVYDFFVQESVLYQIQQGGICTFTNLVSLKPWMKREDKRKRRLLVKNYPVKTGLWWIVINKSIKTCEWKRRSFIQIGWSSKERPTKVSKNNTRR